MIQYQSSFDSDHLRIIYHHIKLNFDIITTETILFRKDQV